MFLEEQNTQFYSSEKTKSRLSSNIFLFWIIICQFGSLFLSQNKKKWFSNLILTLFLQLWVDTVMAKNIGTLSNCDQRQLWKWTCIVNPFYFLFFYLKKSNLSLDNRNLKWGKISLWNKSFSQIHVGHNYWHP